MCKHNEEPEQVSTTQQSIEQHLCREIPETTPVQYDEDRESLTSRPCCATEVCKRRHDEGGDVSICEVPAKRAQWVGGRYRADNAAVAPRPPHFAISSKKHHLELLVDDETRASDIAKFDPGKNNINWDSVQSLAYDAVSETWCLGLPRMRAQWYNVRLLELDLHHIKRLQREVLCTASSRGVQVIDEVPRHGRGKRVCLLSANSAGFWIDKTDLQRGYVARGEALLEKWESSAK